MIKMIRDSMYFQVYLLPAFQQLVITSPPTNPNLQNSLVLLVQNSKWKYHKKYDRSKKGVKYHILTHFYTYYTPWCMKGVK